MHKVIGNDTFGARCAREKIVFRALEPILLGVFFFCFLTENAFYNDFSDFLEIHMFLSGLLLPVAAVVDPVLVLVLVVK